MNGVSTLDIHEIASIEILMKAIGEQSERCSSELGLTLNMLRRYIDTHSPNYFSLAKEAFSEIDPDIRMNIKSKADRLAQESPLGAREVPDSVATIQVNVATKPNYGWMIRERDRR